MTGLQGRLAVVTGGTDGIGAATALELCARGAEVVIIGRSADKADRVVSLADTSRGGTIRAVIADLSLISTVVTVARDIARSVSRIDILVHAVGIMLRRTEHTAEGIEKDFAVSYLARFAFLEHAAAAGLLHPQTRLVNISASSPSVPSWAQMEFASVEEVRARVGMKSHGQAQLANDLLTAMSPERYGILAVGYGPGSVNTQIRREMPVLVRALMAPIFRFTTRQPADVATQLVDIVEDPALRADVASWFTKRGSFEVSGYVASTERQQELVRTSLTLMHQALENGSSTHG